ncbi:hypothetical protein PNOK_0163100 [Pyrrhoderma noxium]|uniref:DUF6593 domain-containing protein n=1 Tax=Pyrrhoderma noxium TaxID=2282107 RepID=A0A286UQ81_9AGAM|nr:hypothetical protein PNOK_0163100 [Pyrrhoderma noxium]
MELTFNRCKIAATTFTSSSTGAPIYRTTTTRRGLIFPEKTTIEYIGSQDTEKHRVVAEIIWRWPSQKRSYVHIGGNLYSLDEFLMLGPGFANTDAYLKLKDEIMLWRPSAPFEPQLQDSQGRVVAQYKRKGHFRICEALSNDWIVRDTIFTSFFIYKTCRDIWLPWKKYSYSKPVEMKVEMKKDSPEADKGDYVRLQ